MVAWVQVQPKQRDKKRRWTPRLNQEQNYMTSGSSARLPDTSLDCSSLIFAPVLAYVSNPFQPVIFFKNIYIFFQNFNIYWNLSTSKTHTHTHTKKGWKLSFISLPYVILLEYDMKMGRTSARSTRVPIMLLNMQSQFQNKIIIKCKALALKRFLLAIMMHSDRKGSLVPK